MAHPVVASSATANTGSGTASGIDLPAPSGIASGDLLVAFISIGFFVSSPTAPSGWTRDSWGSFYPDHVEHIYWKVASSGDEGAVSYSWSWTAYAPVSASILRVTGADQTAPLYVRGSAGSGSTSSSHVAPSLNATETETLLLAFAAVSGTGTYTAPSGMTEVTDVTASSGNASSVARLNLSSTGSTGTKTFTGPTGNWTGYSFGVKQQAAAVDATVTPAVGELVLADKQAVTSDQVVFMAVGALTLYDQPVTALTPDATVFPALGLLTLADQATGAGGGTTVEPATGALRILTETTAGVDYDTAGITYDDVITYDEGGDSIGATALAGSTVSPATGLLVLTDHLPGVGSGTPVVVGSEFPLVTVEFSPTTGPLETPVWVDITDYVLGVSWKVGREHALEGEYSPATASVTLANETRRFDPEHAAGPYYGELTPGRRLRIRVTYDSVTYDTYAGFVDGWPQRYQFPELADCEVGASDGLTLLGWAETNASPFEARMEDLVPLHWWRLDEKAGATEVADSGTGRRNGHPVGGAQDSLEFSPGVDRISEATCLQLRNSGGGYIDVTGCAQWTTFTALAKGDPVAGQGIDYLWSATNGTTWQFVGMYGNTGRITACDGVTQRTTSGAYNDGQVHHIAVVTAFGTCNIYVDGVLDNGSNSPADPTPSGSKSYIGNHIEPSSTKWNGKVGHVALWNTALTATQISGLQETIVGWDDDTTGDRVGHLLDLAGWPTADRDISVNGTLLGAVNGQDWTDDVLANIKIVEASEAGQFYQQPDYTMRFRARTDPLTDPRSTTPRYVFSDEDTTGVYRYESLKFGEQSTYLHNRVKVTYSGGEVIVADDASVAAYGARDHSISTTLGTAAQARNLADAVLYQFSYPRLIVESIELNPAADQRLWLPCLDLQIGDRVTVRRHPQAVGTAISVDVIVEGVTARIGDGRNTATFVLSCSTPMSPGGPGGGGGGGDDFWLWGTGLWDTTTRWA